MEEGFYPCIFLMNDYLENDKDLDRVAYYRFRSTKSNLFYIVRVEVYRHHVYGVKFFLKKMNFSHRKYTFITNTNEPRRIVYSVFHLMMDIYKKDSCASFMFVGNADEGQDYKNTRRFRLYRQLVSNTISERFFSHVISEEMSLYILLNKQNVDKVPGLQDLVVNEYLRRFIQDEAYNSVQNEPIRLNRY